jgi:glycosyltransferase involved in cell wall biosynthesis
MELSIVVPIYNEENNIEVLFSAIKEVCEEKIKTSWEVIFVDDGSSDHSWDKINALSRTYKQIKGFRFSRNFGHQYALKAGLDIAQGDAVISLDADMQHPPELIAVLYQKWKEGNHIVNTIRKNTKGVGWIKKSSSRLFYKLMNFLSDVKIEDGSSDFRLLDKQVLKQFKDLSEYFLFIRGIVSWLGYQSANVEFVAEERFSGKSKYSLQKMLRFAKDGIMSFSIKPLRLATFLGFLISGFAFAYIIYALIAKYVLHITGTGWASLLISILLLGGIQLITIGIIGEYIGKIFIALKKRPHYIISEQTNQEAPDEAKQIK